MARYYHYDGTGHVRAITDSTGAVVERYDYDAFGALRNTPTGLSNDRRFTGEQHDAETAYTYLRARYYDPALGRFISKDPFKGVKSDPQTLNGYIYSVNNPVNRVDRSGKESMVVSTPGCMWSTADFCDGVGPVIGAGVTYLVIDGIIHVIDEATRAVIGVLDDMGVMHSGSNSNTGEPVHGPLDVTPHARQRMAERGWDENRVREALDNQVGKHAGDDTSFGVPTTIHPHPDGGYVVTRTDTGQVIGVSDPNDPNWAEPNPPPP